MVTPVGRGVSSDVGKRVQYLQKVGRNTAKNVENKTIRTRLAKKKECASQHCDNEKKVLANSTSTSEQSMVDKEN